MTTWVMLASITSAIGPTPRPRLPRWLVPNLPAAGRRGLTRARHTHLQAPAPIAISRFTEPQIAFDTHAFVKRLTGAGMPESQAAIIAWGQARRNEHLATQPDLKALKLTLKNGLEKGGA